jgi:hypothetical protein
MRFKSYKKHIIDPTLWEGTNPKKQGKTFNFKRKHQTGTIKQSNWNMKS